MEGVTSGLGRFDLPVNGISPLIDGFDNDSLIQNGGPLAHIQKCVGLLAGNDFMQPVAVFDLPGMLVFLADLDDQIVGLRVLETHKIELMRTGLTLRSSTTWKKVCLRSG